MKKRHAQVECAEKAAAMKTAAEQDNQLFVAREESRQPPPRQVRQRSHLRTRDGADGDDAEKQRRFHHVNPPELVSQQELLGFADLKTIGIPYSREHIWRLIKAKKFPPPVKFGDGANCRCFFPRSEISKWIERKRAA